MANNLRFQSDSSLTSTLINAAHSLSTLQKLLVPHRPADLSKVENRIPSPPVEPSKAQRSGIFPSNTNTAPLPKGIASPSSFTNFSLPPKSVKAPAGVGAAGYPLTAALVSQNELSFESCFSSTAPFSFSQRLWRLRSQFDPVFAGTPAYPHPLWPFAHLRTE
jgi:hypothetical protein